jgi:hypothetical protein
MTVAVLEALTLRRHLDRSGEPRPRRFLQDIARAVDVPWDMAVGGDLVFPDVPGRRTPKVRMLNAYVTRLHAAASTDATLARAFVRAAGLLDRPQALLRPDRAFRVLRSRHHRSGPVVSDDPVPSR